MPNADAAGLKISSKSIARLLRTRSYRRLCAPRSFDLFKLLDTAVVENSWSALLAFLCDSNETHGVGTAYFESWQEAIEAELKRTGQRHAFRIPRKGVVSCRTHFQWATPKGRIVDVMIELLGRDGNPRCVLGIENKRGAAEQADQIRDYQLALREVYPKVPTAVLFLTPDGAASETATKSGPCPCVPISYRTVTEACRRARGLLSGDVRLLMASMERHLEERPAEEDGMREDAKMRRLVRGLYSDPKHRMAMRTLNEFTPSVRRFLERFEWQVVEGRDEMTGNKPKGQIYFNTYPGSSMNPREIKVWFSELDDKTDKLGFWVGFMLHADDLNPDVGSEYTLRVMAWCKNQAARKRAHELRGLLRDKNPVRQWHSWESLWVGGKYRLQDLGSKDAAALAALVDEGLRTAYGKLRRALA